MRITLELKLAPTPQPAASAAHAPLQQSAQHVGLQAWAEKAFGEYAPRYSTLRKWVLEGRISPPPQKDGWNWLVDPNAQYREKS